MKKLLLVLSLFIAIESQAVVLINVSQFPNITLPGTNYLILFTQPGVTNYNMNILQFENWLATEPTFLTVLSSNLNVNSTNWPSQTVSPNYIFTNTVSWWTTNVNFTSAAVYNPSPITSSRLMVSNSSSLYITNTLPFNAYSLSKGAVVSQAIVAPTSVLDIRIDYFNGAYYVEDYGKNNATLVSLTTNTASGQVFMTNGVLYVHP